jgi:SagB-type dehydrogenase family enzyme
LNSNYNDKNDDKNKEIKYALDYHEDTKHSQLSVQMSRHYLDFDDMPRPFKVYPDLPSIPLPQDFAIPATDALTCIRDSTDLMQAVAESQHTPPLPFPSSSSSLDIRTLAQLLFFSAGITREMKFNSGTYYMRAASATGALYPIELYIISSPINNKKEEEGTSGLAAGVYHFCPGDFSLVKLRDGDYTAKLAEAAGGNPYIRSAPVTLAFTSLAWRNAWKYGDRSYRHWFWDSGVIAANLLAVSLSAGLRPSPLVMGFVDSQVNDILFLKQGKEAAIVLAPLLPYNSARINDENNNNFDNSVTDYTASPPEYLAISKRETAHPEIWKIHEASSLSSSEDVKEWLQGMAPRAITGSINNNIDSIRSPHQQQEEPCKERAGRETEAAPKFNQSQEEEEGLQQQHPESKKLSIGDVILRRGSTRQFSSSAAISKSDLMTILFNSTRGVPLDFLSGEPGRSLIDIYLIANAVHGLSSGHFFYDRQHNLLEQLATKTERASRSESGYLCLGQPLFSDASAVLFMMADLEAILKILGNRGYRASQFEAGVVAGKVYLCSYALGLGASGSTFYDDAVTECFSPHSKSKAAMIAVGIGVPAYKARPGKLLAARLTRDELLSNK